MLTITPETALQGRKWAIVNMEPVSEEDAVYALYRHQSDAERIAHDLNVRRGHEKYSAAKIERPTCHIEMVDDDFIPPDTRKYMCDKCDETFLFARGFYPCFCPNCGAKVMQP